MKKSLAIILSAVLFVCSFVCTAFAETTPVYVDGIIYSSDMTVLVGYMEYCNVDDTVVVPDSVTAIADGAFRVNQSIKKIVLTANVKTIGKDAFADSNIEQIVIPAGVEKIESNAFKNCMNLTEITFPASAEIDNSALIGCTNLKKVSVSIPGDETMVYTVGDTDQMNGITAADARYTLRMAAGLMDVNIWDIFTSDINRDGKITAADARAILIMSAELA